MDRSVKRWISYFGIALLLCAVGFATIREPSEARIRKVLAQAISLAEVKAPEHPVEKLQKAQKLAALMTETVSVEGILGEDSHRVSGKKEFREKINIARSAMSSLELKLEIKEIKVSGKQAAVIADFSALGAMPGAEGQFFDQHRISIGVVLDGGDWLVQSVKHLENLRSTQN